MKRYFHSLLLIFIVTGVFMYRGHLFAQAMETPIRIIPHSPGGQMIYLNHLIQDNLTTYSLKLSRAIAPGTYDVTLYTHTGAKLLFKTVQLNQSVSHIPAEKVFGALPYLPAGFYFFRLTPSSPAATNSPGAELFFQDASNRLPGDSLPAAFTDFVDVTGDSFPDIISGINAVMSPAQPQLFENDSSGHFLNETTARFPSLSLYVNDVMTLDVDGDGDRDIYFAANDSTGNIQNGDRLLLNDGQGFFIDAGGGYLPTLPTASLKADWGYINSDPYPDIVLTLLLDPFAPSLQTALHILFNDGSGHFTDHSSLLPPSQYNAVDARLCDVNGDSLTDIAIASLGDLIITDPNGNPIDTLSGRNAVFIQQPDGTFTDETAARMPDYHRVSKLLKVADLNNDGAPELYSINIGFNSGEALNVLYLNDGSGVFSDETANRLPAETYLWNNDAEFIDFDRNGFNDMFMINVLPGGPAPDVLYFNEQGNFSDQSQHLPPIIDFNASCAPGDMEQDSDWDIFISVAPETVGVGLPDLLYENIIPVTGIDEHSIAPVTFQLEQNFPNPFNPETNLRFRIPRGSGPDAPNGAGGLVELKIFDILGQEVKTLVKKNMVPGTYTVKWDGSDDNGVPVASGVYLYRLKINDHFVQTKKMILLR